MITTENLHFTYPASGPSFVFPDIRCDKGEHLLVLGESGKGKTTLLHLLAGLLHPQTGKVEIAGKDTTRMSGRTLDRFRGEHVGIVFQTAHFVSSLNVIDNLILPQFLTGTPVNRKKAELILGRLGIASKALERPHSLSVGEQQRVAIARAVMNEPSVILADEPTSALDDRHASEVMLLLEEQAAEAGASLVIVTHDQRLKDRFGRRVQL